MLLSSPDQFHKFSLSDEFNGLIIEGCGRVYIGHMNNWVSIRNLVS